jgi:serine/threonine protein kinase
MSDSFIGRAGKTYSFLGREESIKMKLCTNIDHPEGRLGNGASGEVWLVEVSSASMSPYFGALKVYNRRLAEHPKSMKQFNTEARFKLKDTRFIQPIDSGQITIIDGRHAILFPYVKCNELYKYIKENDRSISMESRIALVQQLAAAVSQLLRRDWLHNDIKPQNVLHVGESSIRLIDFQLACAQADVNDLYGDTKRSARLGTDGYQAPEVLSGGASKVSVSSDTWALGCTVYYILTGKEVFDTKGINTNDEKQNLMVEMRKNREKPIITSKQMIADGINSNLARVIERMLIPKMNYRTTELVTILNHLCKINIGTHSIVPNPNINVVLKNRNMKKHDPLLKQTIKDTFSKCEIKDMVFINKHIYLEMEYKEGESLEVIKDANWGGMIGEFNTYLVGEVGRYTGETRTPVSPIDKTGRVRVTIIPNSKPKQFIIIDANKEPKYVRSIHFSGHDFGHSKLLKLKWDGYRMLGASIDSVTLKGKKLSGNTEIKNNDILHFDGLPTRIIFEAL